MTKLELLKSLKLIELCYNKKFNTEEVDLWYEIFMDWESIRFRKAIVDTIKKSHFEPKVADIIESDRYDGFVPMAGF